MYKPCVILEPADPIRVHILEQVVTAKGLEKRTNVRSSIGGDNGTIWQAIGSVRRGNRVILAVKITVLRVTAVTEIGPQSYSIY